MENSREHSLTYAYLLNKYGLKISWEEAAEELGVYWENLRKLCKNGDIIAQKVGRKWVLTTKALADFIDNGAAVKVAVEPEKKKRGHHKYVSA